MRYPLPVTIIFHNIRRTRKYITTDVYKTLAHDFGNTTELWQHSPVWFAKYTGQTSAEGAAFDGWRVTCTHKREPITPALNSSYWLSVINKSPPLSLLSPTYHCASVFTGVYCRLSSKKIAEIWPRNTANRTTHAWFELRQNVLEQFSRQLFISAFFTY